MKARTQATIEELYRVPGKAELVDGEIIHMSPTGGLPGYAADELFYSLRDYAREMERGIAVSDNKGFVVNLPHRKSFSPDAAYYVGDVGPGFYQGAPIFAVEVRSEGDYGPSAERSIVAKIRDYLAAGTIVVWDVDVLREGVVRVYRSAEPDKTTLYRRGELAEAEPALPGWSIPVDSLFYSPNKKTLE